jgi:hypothetical protein
MPNPSQKKFDSQLFEISHLNAYPALLPFIGQNFESPSHKKMLLIGESYYFPDDSSIHHDVDGWYAATQERLTDEEVSYMNCRGLLECDWGSPGHGIYREINRRLAELPLESSDRAVSHIAFMNAFYRPANIPGESFKHGCTPLDVDRAIDITKEIVGVLEPNLVIYVSKYSWDTVGWKIAESLAPDSFHFTSHPGDPFYWTRTGYPHGRKKFEQILRDQFLHTTQTS